LPYIKSLYKYKLQHNKIGLIKLHKLYTYNNCNRLIIKQYSCYIENQFTENQWLALVKCYKVDYSFLKLAYNKLYNIDNQSEIFNWCNLSITNDLYYNEILYNKIKRKQICTKYYINKYKKIKIYNK